VTDPAKELVERVQATALALRARHSVVEASALRQDDDFTAVVDLLAASDQAPAVLGQLLDDADVLVMQIVFAAIAVRGQGPKKWERRALRRLANGPNGEIPIILDALATAAPRPVIAAVLGHVNDSWVLLPAVAEAVQRFLDLRVAAEETPDPWDLENRIREENRDAVLRLVESSSERVRAALLPPIEERPGHMTDAEFFSQFGRIVDATSLPQAAAVAGREVAIDALVAALAARKSVLLVGEPGVGKTTVLGEALRRAGEEWFVFQATAADVHAGQAFVGMLEGRVQEIAAEMKDKRIVWVLPNFEEALWAGQHLQSPRGLLDAVMPYVEARQIIVVGETDPLAYEMLVQLRPRLVRTFDTVRLSPMTEEEALAVAAEWTEGREASVSEETLRESLDLASHYLPGTAAPGNLIRLLELTVERERRTGGVTVQPQSVTETLSEATGLPLHILDPRTPLDLSRLRSFFAGRVLGQPEAVECLTERIALVKAGLTDATRPLGVFFFVGPTGSGKTEIAKALAEFLFGSPDRLVRLDMSEFQTPESLERLLTDSAIEPQAAPLVSSVRKEPFSVVLLDEFEKAHENIWDVFLQVFDDGRLTDRSGRTVDFRHCIVVMTSNIASAIPTRPGLGFGSEAARFDREAVEREVERSFRPEFLNRLDRVVVFHPLARDVMREILDKELTAAIRRRGFRMQPWAIEWDESAITFLLERGFSAELGARPLKRAIERHVLAPLAMTIVERQFPAGDQFLFLSAGDSRGITVTFVDPDDGGTATTPAAQERSGEEPTLPDLVLDPVADGAAIRYLTSQVDQVAQFVERSERDKDDLLQLTRNADFWDSHDRHAVLARIEYLDRFQAAAATATRLLERLKLATSRQRSRAPIDLVRMLAERLFILDHAWKALASDEACDAFLSIDVVGAGAQDSGEAAERLVEAYVSWGERRGMRIQRLKGQAPASHRLAVTGLGAFRILKHEHGLHVFEKPKNESKFTRQTVHVTVAPWRVHQQEQPPEAQADEALREVARSRDVVRRYREQPSPLVRDSRGWRTGRLDRVLGGDFDLFA
jgi:ATP-dependent Clp protease ATP-binding subunit ClpC